jgi:hypothetical protein
MEAQFSQRRARQARPWKPLGLTHGAQRRLQLISYPSDELGWRLFERNRRIFFRRGFLIGEHV